MNELLDAVKELVVSVRGYLDSDTGNDDCHIVAMEESVVDVLSKARGIPELREWAQKVTDGRDCYYAKSAVAWAATFGETTGDPS